uniref:Uncharacterized protein n=1 Tax=Oryza glaberrima TaxID=4538 RepID=I1P2V8_ORYGL
YRLGVILAWDVFFCSHRIRSELRCTQSPRYSSPGLAALSAPSVAIRIPRRRLLVHFLSRIVRLGADECGGVRASDDLEQEFWR